MKQTVLFLLIFSALVFVSVCTKDKPPKPPLCEDPGCYYPRQKGYSWRYIELGSPGCDVVSDTFILTILDANVRHGDVGFDRFRNADTNSIIFIFKKADTLFLEKVGGGVPLLKILVGPIRAGTYWRDQNFDYLIQGFENVTLSINGVTHKRCAKIMKTNRNHPEANRVFEWWSPEYGEVKEVEQDTSGTCQKATELDKFSTDPIFP